MNIPLAHVEAGLRSYNPIMPEELNRILTDHCSTLLFCPTDNAVKNLKKEGLTNISKKREGRKIIQTGDIMCDALRYCLKIAEEKSRILQKFNLSTDNYYLATVHRAENTNDGARLERIFEVLSEISRKMPVIFPIHPRTQKLLKHPAFKKTINQQLKIIKPVSYFDMLLLEKNAHRILTDSGGVQKEAFLFKIPCITLRDETEWTETLRNGWNTLVGTNKKAALRALRLRPSKRQSCAIFGDGKTAIKISTAIENFLATSKIKIPGLRR